MRTKEWAHDYRYFPEPDLVPVRIEREWLDAIRAELPELPEARRQRFVAEYGLPEYNATLLIDSKPLADFFEECVAMFPDPKTVSNWLMGTSNLVQEGLSRRGQDWMSVQFVHLLKMQAEGVVNALTAKKVLEEMVNTGEGASDIIHRDELTQVSAEGALQAVIDQVLQDHPQVVQRVRAGKTQAKAFLVGQVMKATNGRANPKIVNELLNKAL
jgi:aspartyl-tRNA(Asn)/glutamyl-tRNA(Gln) amidotransferase subunit B